MRWWIKIEEEKNRQLRKLSQFKFPSSKVRTNLDGRSMSYTAILRREKVNIVFRGFKIKKQSNFQKSDGILKQ